MKHQESKSAILLRHYLKAHPYHTCAIETKDTRGKDSLLFSEVKQAQIDYGMAIKSDNGVLIRTQAISEGLPDYLYLKNEPSLVVIKYPKMFAMIDIETFILEKKKSKRKSLTSKRAGEIAIKTIKTKNT